MIYEVKYKYRLAGKTEKWVELREVHRLEDLYNLLKWMGENSEGNILISIEPLKRREK